MRLVSKRIKAAGIVEVENLLALAGSFAREKIGHVIRVEANLCMSGQRPILFEEGPSRRGHLLRRGK